MDPRILDRCRACGHTRRYHEPACFQWMEPKRGSPYAYNACGCPNFRE